MTNSAIVKYTRKKMNEKIPHDSTLLQIAIEILPCPAFVCSFYPARSRPWPPVEGFASSFPSSWIPRYGISTWANRHVTRIKMYFTKSPYTILYP